MTSLRPWPILSFGIRTGWTPRYICNKRPTFGEETTVTIGIGGRNIEIRGTDVPKKEEEKKNVNIHRTYPR